MIYGVELSRGIAAMAGPKGRARRGIDKNAILEAAFAMFSGSGEAAFSVRKLGQAAGVDPMTVLHHFGSKNELLRRIADRALGTIEIPEPSGDWRLDLRNVADAYRDLAQRHPNVFHLHFRYHATGPADHTSSEIVYRAMRSIGLADGMAAGLGLAFYSFVLGFGLAEIEGQLRAIDDGDEAELMSLDAADFPATRALVPAFKELDPDAAFEVAISAFIAGVEQKIAKSAPAAVRRKPAAAVSANGTKRGLRT